jgi:hypothetical protein
MRVLAALVLTIGMSTALGAPDVHASRAASPKEWLLFDSTRTGRSEIYALPAAGRVLRQLTFRGGWAPRPSPDGRYILFDRSDGTWIMGPDGRGAKLILRGATQAVWAPDSRRIAYVASADGIRIANRDGCRSSSHARARASAASRAGGSGDSTSTCSPVTGCGNASRAACKNWRSRPRSPFTP